MNLEVDKHRLMSEIEELALISDAEAPAVTRIVFTLTDLRARAWLMARCEEAGLAIRQDAIGNIFARWNGRELNAAAVGTGSHTDAIPNAGKYDGVVGVLGGLEAIRALRQSGFSPQRSIELILFTSEEPTRFGIGCLGSRLLSGILSPDAAKKLTDKDGASIEQIRRAAGFRGELETVKLPAGHYQAFVELHIEQGPLLEQKHIPLGIVSKIAAPSSFRIFIEGAGGHAGGVLMPDRRDALCAASELILAIEHQAKTGGSTDTVATVGICEVFPGAVNSIPSRVHLSVDIRDTDLQRRDSLVAKVDASCQAIAAKRGLAIRQELVNADAPADCASNIVEALSESCRKHGVTFLTMVSRAYHDSLFMSRIAPAGMLFIPCRNGYSHRPDEYASPEDIARGTLVLAETLQTLAG
ncbi:MAG TPA: M20 family metallo-hydrolase [Methylomirabilota bacterium]|jgi:N-carbamoyl-L-amino-acid hydrolase|nr:M20 family metallo-hydrolase [Methylomirabilota bacterium]